jgi:hypothetical protein
MTGEVKIKVKNKLSKNKPRLNIFQFVRVGNKEGGALF